jgi:hypothetical protein
VVAWAEEPTNETPAAPAVAKPAEALAGELVHVRPKKDRKDSKDLLNQIDTAKDVVYTAPENPVPVEQQFQFIDGVLRTPAEGHARLCLPVEVPKFYHLSLSLKSTAPKDNRPVGIGVVLAGRQCLLQSRAEKFELGEFLGRSIAGKRQIIPNHWFGLYTTGPEGITELTVGDTGFVVQNDGKYFEWFGTPGELSLDPKWAAPQTDKLFLVAPAGQFDIVSVKLDPLTRDQWLTEISALLPDGRIAWADYIVNKYKLTPTVDPLPELDNLRPTIRLLGYRGDFDALEQWAERFRRESAVIGHQFASEALYTWLSQLYLVSNDGGVGSWPELWQMQFAFTDAWLKHRPDSVAARIVKARSCIQYAWDARWRERDDYRVQDSITWNVLKGDRSDKNSSQRERLFHQRMEQAQRILEEASPMQPRDACVFSALLAVGAGQEWDREKMEIKLERGLQITKRDYHLYESMVDYLLARTHQERGVLGKFAEQMCARCDHDDGLDVYARIAMASYGHGSGFGEFSDEKLKVAIPVWIKRFSHDSFMMNYACWMCCQLDDPETAKTLFDQHVQKPDFKVWDDRDGFDHWRHWCDPSVPEAPKFLASDGQESTNLQACASGPVHLAFLPDNQTLATAGALSGTKVKFWDLKQQTLTDTITQDKPDSTIEDFRFLPNGKYFALINDGDEKFGLYHEAPDYDSAYIPAIPGLMFASDDFNTWVMIKDGKATADQMHATGERKEFAVPEMSNVALSRDGNRLLGVDKKILIWNTRTAEEAGTIDVQPLKVVFLEDNTAVAYATENKLVVWDITGRRERFSAPLDHCTVRAIASSRDGRLLATADTRIDAKGTERHVVSLWDLKQPQPIQTFAAHQQPLGAVVFSPDAKLLASSSIDGVVKVWDVAKAAAAPNP